MLFNELFEDYSNALRPVEDTDKVLNVTLQITLSQIKDMVSKGTVLFFFLKMCRNLLAINLSYGAGEATRILMRASVTLPLEVHVLQFFVI